MSTIQVIGLFKTENTGKYFSKLLVQSDIEVVSITYTAEEFKVGYSRLRPPVVVMDITWPQENLFEQLVEWLKASDAQVRVIGLSNRFRPKYIPLLKSLEAWGYIWLLHESVDNAVERIRLVHDGIPALEVVTPERKK